MATQTKPVVSTKTTKRAGTTRHPKFTAIENAIIADGLSHGATKALAIQQVRKWEGAGADPETIAAFLRFDEGDGASPELGKAQTGDEAAAQKFKELTGKLDDGDASEAQLDALMAMLGGMSGSPEGGEGSSDKEDEDNA